MFLFFLFFKNIFSFFFKFSFDDPRKYKTICIFFFCYFSVAMVVVAPKNSFSFLSTIFSIIHIPFLFVAVEKQTTHHIVVIHEYRKKEQPQCKDTFLNLAPELDGRQIFLLLCVHAPFTLRVIKRGCRTDSKK